MVKSNVLTVVDLGSSSVSLACVRVIAPNQCELICHVKGVSEGIKKGSVVNIDAASKAIGDVIEKAQSEVSFRIKSAFLSISGDKVHSVNSLGVVPIRHHEIVESDIDAVIESATATPLASDQKIIHVIPQDYSVDCQPGIKDPLGMSGVRLETCVHIICGNDRSIQNLRKCMQSCNIKLDGIIFEGLASSQSTVSCSEKDQGVCVVDIGSGTSSITVYQSGALVYTAVLPFAGDQVTNDIAHALKTSYANAEKLKINQGSFSDDSDLNQELEYRGLDAKRHSVTRDFLMQVIEARYSEIFQLIRQDIHQFNPKWKRSFGAGIVLTGGASQLDGLDQFAQSILDTHVRVVDTDDRLGHPDLEGCDSATLVGLVKYCTEQQYKGTVVKSKYRQSFKRLREWLEVNF